MTCFECGKPIETMDDCFFLGLDFPYINLAFHKNGCKSEILKTGEAEYLEKNKERIFKWAKEK